MFININRYLPLLSLALLPSVLVAQEERIEHNLTSLQRRIESLEQKQKRSDALWLSGYVQGVYQTGEEDALLSVGAKGEQAGERYSRIGVRRARLKLNYDKGLSSAVFQVDFTERGIGLKDAYFKLSLPFSRASSVQAGIFDRPFGYEIRYSSSRRETVERSRIMPELFPNERDLGVMLSLRADKGSRWHILKLDAGLFAGQGLKPDVDSRLDFISRLSAEGRLSRGLELSGGVSLYYGGVYQTTSELYRMQGNAYIREDKPQHIGAYVRRSYFGLDAQLVWYNVLGRTQVHAEWIAGQQPSTATSHRSPNGSLQTTAMYLRPIEGGYVLLTQGISKSPLSLFVKYDWFDPNTRLAGHNVGKQYSTEADLAYRTLSLGAMYQLTDALRLTFCAEQVWNEQSSNLPKFVHDRKDNRLTLATLYRF